MAYGDGIDFEKLVDDAFEVINVGAFRGTLPTWDCDSIVVMNAGGGMNKQDL